MRLLQSVIQIKSVLKLPFESLRWEVEPRWAWAVESSAAEVGPLPAGLLWGWRNLCTRSHPTHLQASLGNLAKALWTDSSCACFGFLWETR
jgi:hypothetical protein